MTSNQETLPNSRGETISFLPFMQSDHLQNHLQSKIDPVPYTPGKDSYSFPIPQLREGISPSFDLREISFDQVAKDCDVDVSNVSFCIILRDDKLKKREICYTARNQVDLREYWSPPKPIKSALGFDLVVSFVLTESLEHTSIFDSGEWFESDPPASDFGSILSSRTYIFRPDTPNLMFPLIPGKEPEDGEYKDAEWYIDWHHGDYRQTIGDVLTIVMKPSMHEWFAGKYDGSDKSKHAPTRGLVFMQMLEEIYIQVFSETDDDYAASEEDEPVMESGDKSLMDQLVEAMAHVGMDENQLKMLIGAITDSENRYEREKISGAKAELRKHLAKMFDVYVFSWEKLNYGT